jgi:mannose-6-phosphate isomerase-like protein (cupin superfamily)
LAFISSADRKLLKYFNHHIIIKEEKMKGYVGKIEEDTLKNSNFRKVLYSAEHCQLVLMSLKPKEEIGMEVHKDNDQFFRFEKGEGMVIIDGHKYKIKDGFAVIVPAGSDHNIINTSSKEELKMYTIYSPAHHKDKTIHKTKQIAESSEEEFDGKTTE